MQCHMKALCPHCSVTRSEEDSDSTMLESLLYDNEDVESDRLTEDEASEKADPSCPCEEAPGESNHCQAATLVITRTTSKVQEAQCGVV